MESAMMKMSFESRKRTFAMLSNIPKERRSMWLHSEGWYHLGEGSFKQTFAHKERDYVVKLVMWSNPEHPEYGGAFEADNALDAPTHLMPSLLPVWQGNDFQIQDRVEQRSCPDPCECQLLLSGVTDMATSCGPSPARNHTHDEEGMVLIYDYGQDWQWQNQPLASVRLKEAA
jgi:hypothetical protein